MRQLANELEKLDDLLASPMNRLTQRHGDLTLGQIAERLLVMEDALQELRAYVTPAIDPGNTTLGMARTVAMAIAATCDQALHKQAPSQ